VSVDFTLATPAFLRAFGEEVGYTPSGGEARTITAVVDRDPPAPLAQAADQVRPRCIIEVGTDPDDADYGGIAPADFDGGADTFSLAVRVGGTAQTLRGRIIAQDAGMMALELR